MEPITVHTGTAVRPAPQSNVDTDQIIPAVYLKRVTRTGFEDGLFAAWRNDPDFVLNRPESQGASILVAGPDFGTGSSREHAVWALQRLRLPGRRLGAVRRHLPRQRRQGRAGHRPGASRRTSSGSGRRSRTTRPSRSPSTSRRGRCRGRQVTPATRRRSTSTTTRAGGCMEGLDDVDLTLRHEPRSRRTRVADRRGCRPLSDRTAPKPRREDKFLWDTTGNTPVGVCGYGLLRLTSPTNRATARPPKLIGVLT